MSKFRTNKIKHQHTIIAGLRAVLEAMAACPDIHALIPGPISPHHTSRGVSVTLQYETDTGWKLLGRNGSAIQEVFVVADAREAVRRWLLEQRLIAGRETGSEPVAPPDPAQRPDHGKVMILQFEHACGYCGRAIRPGSRAVCHGTGTAAVFLHTRCAHAGWRG